MGLSRPTKKWTRKELSLLKRHYGKITKRQLVDRYLPGRPFDSVTPKASELGLTRDKSLLWEAWEVEIVRNHYRSNPLEIHTKYLPHRSVRAIVHQAKALRVCKYKQPPWTAEEDRIIRKVGRSMTLRELQGNHLPLRSLKAVNVRVWRILGAITPRSGKPGRG
jgi:hypothetical protein